MPHIIICTEAWKSDATKLNQLHGYNMYSTSDTMNKSDGVVVFIQENINQSTEIIKIGEMSALHTTVFIENKKIQFTSIYRSK